MNILLVCVDKTGPWPLYIHTNERVCALADAAYGEMQNHLLH